MRLRTWLAALLAVALALVVPPLLSSGSDGAATTGIRGLRVMVPNTPGGGYDITARTAATTMEEAKLTSNPEVFNLPGAGGTVGLGRTVNERGNDRLVMSMGLGVVGSVYTNNSPSTLQDTTPIAKLIEEPNIFVVAKDSPYRSFGQLLDDWREKPGSVPVGGGSSPGGPDHLAPMMTAKAGGIDPKDVNYVPYDGGGELLASVLGGKVDFGVSGISEYRDQIEAGELRVLAVTSEDRIPGVDAPTMRELGLDVRFANWRGVVAPPGLSDAERKRLITLFTKMRNSPRWKQTLARNGWTDSFQSGPRFGAFLDDESDRVAGLLDELGVA